MGAARAMTLHEKQKEALRTYYLIVAYYYPGQLIRTHPRRGRVIYDNRYGVFKLCWSGCVDKGEKFDKKRHSTTNGV
jgi:hypothetical protein